MLHTVIYDARSVTLSKCFHWIWLKSCIEMRRNLPQIWYFYPNICLNSMKQAVVWYYWIQVGESLSNKFYLEHVKLFKCWYNLICRSYDVRLHNVEHPFAIQFTHFLSPTLHKIGWFMSMQTNGCFSTFCWCSLPVVRHGDIMDMRIIL